jgi:hypothetical protein
MRELIIVLLILFFVGALGTAPGWGWHSAGWGPSGGLGLLFLVLLVLLLTGRL